MQACVWRVGLGTRVSLAPATVTLLENSWPPWPCLQLPTCTEGASTWGCFCSGTEGTPVSPRFLSVGCER